VCCEYFFEYSPSVLSVLIQVLIYYVYVCELAQYAASTSLSTGLVCYEYLLQVLSKGALSTSLKVLT